MKEAAGTVHLPYTFPPGKYPEPVAGIQEKMCYKIPRQAIAVGIMVNVPAAFAGDKIKLHKPIGSTYPYTAIAFFFKCQRCCMSLPGARRKCLQQRVVIFL